MESFFRKYRPWQLSDVAGQETVVRSLSKQATTGRYAQSYLFSGHRGAGKTSIARILASLVNCEKRDPALDAREIGIGDKTCGKCRACQLIHDGICPDVYEIDGASNNGVEEARLVKERAYYTPQEFRNKIFIVDECLGKDSRLNTEDGLKSISWIVRNKSKVKVKSHNQKTGVIEYQPIVGWFKNSGKKVFRLSFESRGVVNASEGHLVSTPDRGYVPVSVLKVGDPVHREGVALDSSQEQLLLASMLGDGNVIKNNQVGELYSGTNPRFRFVHSDAQKAYLYLKYNLLKSFVGTPPKDFMHSGFPGYPPKKMWRFSTRTSPCFRRFINDCCSPSGEKRVSENWLSKVDWMGMAFWFCDDGSLAQYKTSEGTHYQIVLHTQGFTYEEHEVLQNWLSRQGLVSSILEEEKNGHTLYRLSLDVESSLKFLENIWAYVPDEMNFKLKSFIPAQTSQKYRYEIKDQVRSQLVIEKLVAKKFLRYEPCTYDIEVANNHNYFVSGTLVHNCHMLTTAAWNSLLKVVEEPPAYVKFIFCTTNHAKVLPTIVSRSRQYFFQGVSAVDIAKQVAMVASKEKINLDPDAAAGIARLADGSLRDALNYLEEAGIHGNQVTPALLQDLFGQPERRLAMELVKLVADGNTTAVLMAADDLIRHGASVHSVLLEVSEVFRDVMVLEAGATELLVAGPEEKEILTMLSKKLNRSCLVNIAKLLGRIDKEINYNIFPRMILEAALLHCISYVATEAAKHRLQS